jgi:hypothetical protein
MGMTQAVAVATLNPLDPHSLLSSFGALGVFLVLFAETGLLVGFFLPGDSLLFTAGLLCTTTVRGGRGCSRQSPARVRPWTGTAPARPSSSRGSSRWCAPS